MSFALATMHTEAPKEDSLRGKEMLDRWTGLYRGQELGMEQTVFESQMSNRLTLPGTVLCYEDDFQAWCHVAALAGTLLWDADRQKVS